MSATASVAGAARDPGAWLIALGALAARGGLLLAVLAIVAIPSPVFLAIILRDEVATVGRSGFEPFVPVAGAVTGILVVAGTLLGSWLETGLACRVLRHADPSARLVTTTRGDLAWSVAVVRIGWVLPVVVTGTLLAAALSVAITDELIDPSDTAVPLVLRVAVTVLPQLLALAAAVVLSDAAASRMVAHRVLAAHGLPTPGGRPAVRLARTLATALAGWLLLGLAAITLVAPWVVARVADGLAAAWLGTGHLALLVSAASGAILLAAAWLAALAAIGAAGAVRAALWLDAGGRRATL